MENILTGTGTSIKANQPLPIFYFGDLNDTITCFEQDFLLQKNPRMKAPEFTIHLNLNSLTFYFNQKLISYKKSNDISCIIITSKRLLKFKAVEI